jgi:hypothetical protein
MTQYTYSKIFIRNVDYSVTIVNLLSYCTDPYAHPSIIKDVTGILNPEAHAEPFSSN